MPIIKKIAIVTSLILSTAVLLIIIAAYAAIAYFNDRTHGEFFDSNGVQIHYTVEGEGTPVILVHGFSLHPDLAWRKRGAVNRILEEGYQVITLDCRGHGLSGKPHGAENYGKEMPSDIARLMDHLKIEKANVVGYSMGGLITLKLIDMYPERLICAAPCGMTWNDKNSPRLQKLDELSEALQERGDMKPLLELIGVEVSLFGLVPKTVSWFTDKVNDPKALGSAAGSFKDLMVKEEQLKSNQVPTLTIVGTEDPLSEGAEKMNELMNMHTLILDEGGDHGSTPGSELFIENILKFLAEHNH